MNTTHTLYVVNVLALNPVRTYMHVHIRNIYMYTVHSLCSSEFSCTCTGTCMYVCTRWTREMAELMI